MKPIDYRKATFAAIQGHLEGNRRIVYDALRTLGPQTTRALAQLAKMDLLTVRPRITELIDLGLVMLCDDGGRRAKEGTYRALSRAEAMILFTARHAAAVQGEQMVLKV
jgi:predicted transcriptional regulator